MYRVQTPATGRLADMHNPNGSDTDPTLQRIQAPALQISKPNPCQGRSADAVGIMLRMFYAPAGQRHACHVQKLLQTDAYKHRGKTSGVGGAKADAWKQMRAATVHAALGPAACRPVACRLKQPSLFKQAQVCMQANCHNSRWLKQQKNISNSYKAM